jgi:hypothetical protein
MAYGCTIRTKQHPKDYHQTSAIARQRPEANPTHVTPTNGFEKPRQEEVIIIWWLY